MHKDAQRLRLVEQTGVITAGQSETMEWRSPSTYITAINWTGLTLLAGNVSAGDPAGEPLYIIEYPEHMDMPAFFPRKIRECVIP